MSLEDVNVGDTIAVFSGRHYGRRIDRETVIRVTNTRVVTERFAYMRSSGKRVGSSSSYFSPYARAWTDDVNEQFLALERETKLSDARQTLEGHPWRKLSQDQCDAVLALLDSFKSEPQT